ncbi:MAG: cobalt ECF transporter T component CbiQ [SAR324 cluster bacterium]|nr:cobalt ECF transporter T component CbiQ [SAR324 cluster bacterium]
MQLQIDFLSHSNRLRHLPSEQKLLFSAVLFCLSTAAPAAFQILIGIWISVWIVGYAKIPAAVYLKLLAIPMVFLLLSLPALILGFSWTSNLESIRTDILWGFSSGNVFIYCSLKGLQQSSFLLIRSLVLSSCAFFLLLTIPFTDIIRSLRKYGCPVLITELLTLMYRFIYVLTDTAGQLLIAQQVRVGYRNWKTGIRSIGIVTSQLLLQTFTNYRMISLGLNSRGYTGEVKVWSLSRSKSQPRYTIEAIVGSLLIAIGIGCSYGCK